jgi:hypothetical protein
MDRRKELSMRREIVFFSLILPLLCGCIGDTRYLATSASADDLAARAQSHPSSLRYTNHTPSATAAEVISLRITGPFESYDRAKILRAVNEWNVALNGVVRFEIVPDGAVAATTKPWMIVATRGGAPSPAFRGVATLAFTYAIPNAGGVMGIYLDRIGSRDLGGAVMHELGHVLGLGHGDRGLMAAYYHPTDQQCVDRTTITAVAAKRRLPANQLNWCET